jgi:hypothetical protein
VTAKAPGSHQGHPSTMAEFSKAWASRDNALDTSLPGHVIDFHDGPPAIDRYSRETKHFSKEPKPYTSGGRHPATDHIYVRHGLVTNPYSHLSDEDDTDLDFHLSRRGKRIRYIKEVDDYSDSEVFMKNSRPRSRSYTPHRREHRAQGHSVGREFDSVSHDRKVCMESRSPARSPSPVQTEHVQSKVG